MGLVRAAGSVLLLAAIVLAVMGLVRFAVRGPSPAAIPPAAPSGPAAAPAETPRPASAAASALLARIKACLRTSSTRCRHWRRSDSTTC
jgi:hypothetical protein